MLNFGKFQEDSLTLLTDFYQLTMSYGFWKKGLADREAVFHHFFRRHPFSGGFSIAAGLEFAIEYLKNFKFSKSDLDYLATLKGPQGSIFEEGFLKYLETLTFACDVDAVEEGSVIFPYEPITRVKGPLLQCQLLETPLLNLINFQTLIATKAARVRQAAEDDDILEFGLRRAQGVNGAISASRAAFIGGCNATSNTLAGKLFHIPVRGTHSHSWVMVYEDELDSFYAFADVLPDQCIFLVDTYFTLDGVKKAIEVGRELEKRGKKMLGIRLDSGDLNYLSQESRKLLDAAGFKDAKIFASNELDESIITELKRQGAKISVWGVGTNLVTGKNNPALDGVYKLSAIKNEKGEWVYKLKLSEQMKKISNPGILQVRRFKSESGYTEDVIYNEPWGVQEGKMMIDPIDISRQRPIPSNAVYEDLLKPIFRKGQLVYDPPSLEIIQKKCQQELSYFHSGIKRFLYPHQYPVGIEEQLYNLKLELIRKIRIKK